MSQYFPDGLPTNTLIDFYSNIQRALDVDDNTPAGQAKPHGARTNSDFRKMAEDLEKQLDKKRITYRRIVWE